MNHSVPPRRPNSVYFFGTCLIDLFYPEAGLAGMELLEREGIKVLFPQKQTCCGQPARNNGYQDEARAVARLQLDAFPGDWPVVVPSGSCAGMMKTHYPGLFEGDPDHARAVAFSERVYELTQFLVDVLDVKLVDKGAPVTVTWHGSCHSQREMRVVDQPKRLLRQLVNVTFIENSREQECCGFGGTFSVKQPEISAAMVADKVASIETTGASQVISGDCGCLMNISGATEKSRKGFRSRHIAEFLLERCHGR
ncbi:MAG: (Fe-S)-binding protein [Beijerinckiaceae bacterium]